MKVYVFHYTPKGCLPKLTPEIGKAVKEGIGAKLKQNPGVKYNGTMYNPATGKAICDWDAPDTKTVARIFDELKIPYDEAVAVERLAL